MNTQTHINIPFGTTLTQITKLPKDSDRALRDPYANKPMIWPWIITLLLTLELDYYT